MTKGVDVITNKVTDEECDGVAHHLLSVIDPCSENSAFDVRDFVNMAETKVCM